MINNAKSLNYLSHAVCGRRHSKPFIHISMTQKLTQKRQKNLERFNL